MHRWSLRLFGVALILLGLPCRSPAPLIYTPGEGWRYERVGEDRKWQRTRAKDQLQVAQEAFDRKDYGLTERAARRTVAQWPFSDYAPQAQYLLGRSLEEQHKDQQAFKQYQTLIEKYPKVDNYEEVVKRQFLIANRYLAGKWYKLWGYVPIGASMAKTIEMYEKVVKNGPYSEVGPQAQLNIGTAYEKKKVLWFKSPEYPPAVKAYERAADRYADQDKVAAEARFKAGLAYTKQAKEAEYDQSIAAQAISTSTDFITLDPNDPRVPEARKIIGELKTEQARGSYQTARYYEKHGKWQGALIYYNDVLTKDDASSYATEARQRITALNRRLEHSSPPPAVVPTAATPAPPAPAPAPAPTSAAPAAPKP